MNDGEGEARPEGSRSRRGLYRLAVLVASAPLAYFAGLGLLTSAFALVEEAELPGTYIAWRSAEPDRLTLHPGGTYTREVTWEGEAAATKLRSRWSFEGEGLVLHGLGMPVRDASTGRRTGINQTDCRLVVSRWFWWIWLGDGADQPGLEYRKG
ncbi:hypothetical protein [Paludisphaera soli]|uniref:hypothetical protein n=1 Tax=Paludisphaera soli TaxID=2712865 RepID=UPI0013ED1E06|nr:hypothetical protein [Paludisphaera soli]